MNISEYKLAWKEGDTALYIDIYDRKYAAKNGDLAWRINNPGLISRRCRFARKNGSIGTWDQYAIFSNPLQGRQALKEWLYSKTQYQSTLLAIGKYYQPNSPEEFVQNLPFSILPKTRLKDLTNEEFDLLLAFIEKLRGFVRIGNEEFLLLPKIAGKIEWVDKKEFYLVGNNLVLTQEETINWINSHRLDAVVVHNANGTIHLHSRRSYQMQKLDFSQNKKLRGSTELDVLTRIVGEEVLAQCVWGFINGISNRKIKAIESAKLIANTAGNERVFALQNDQVFWGLRDAGIAIFLKTGSDTQIIKNTAKFLRYLLAVSETERGGPVILFAHSQGAAIAEHAITLLSSPEREKIRIFTFGGWSFIPPDRAHPESHNYISVSDLIPRLGSFNLQYLAIRKYEWLKEGLTQDEIIRRLAFEDTIHKFGPLESRALNTYVEERYQFYRNELDKIQNVTVLASDSILEHAFNSLTYQSILRAIVEKYRQKQMNTAGADSKSSSIESFI